MTPREVAKPLIAARAGRAVQPGLFGRAKDLIKRHWPLLRLRTILLGVLLFVAAMPIFGMVFFRLYENTLVRQTESELVAQGAALVAVARAGWPGPPERAPPPPETRDVPNYYRPESPTIDLASTPILAERPLGRPGGRVQPDAEQAARLAAPVFEQTSRTTLASIVLLDRDGRVVIGRERGLSYAALPEVRAALAGHPNTVLRHNSSYAARYRFEWVSRARAVRIHHARPILVNGRVAGALLLSRSPRALFRDAYEDRGKFALLLGLIVIALVVLAGLVSRGVTRPIEALSRATRDVATGQGDVPETPTTAASEIQQLYEDFRTMAVAIDRRSQYLRDFAAAVSHEFKTPLAGISGAAELLDDHGETMTPEERARFLGNIRADTGRLTQLVTRLLDLARADMAQGGAGLTVNLALPVQRVVDALSGPSFATTANLGRSLPHAAASPEAVETVLSILVENSRQAGAGTVVIDAWSDADSVYLRVSDDGPGIPPGDRERLFEPFFTSRRSQGGTGLGLPIARSLMAAYHGAVSLEEADRGAAFVVRLPRP